MEREKGRKKRMDGREESEKRGIESRMKRKGVKGKGCAFPPFFLPLRETKLYLKR